ncbi:predicted protein, partial [Nematostella vectensis]
MTGYLVVASSLLVDVEIPGLILTQSSWAALAGVCVFPALFCKSLKSMAWVSCISNITLIISFIAVLISELSNYATWDFRTLFFWDTRGVLFSINIIVFSYSIQAVVIDIEESMTHRSRFNWVLTMTYSASCVVKTLFAVFGFLSFKKNTNQVV